MSALKLGIFQSKIKIFGSINIIFWLFSGIYEDGSTRKADSLKLTKECVFFVLPDMRNEETMNSRDCSLFVKVHKNVGFLHVFELKLSFELHLKAPVV